MSILLLNATVVNEGQQQILDVFVQEGRIARIGPDLGHLKAKRVIDATGKYLLPGLIDDQVHFREPGLTHKACIASEARAAVAGGVTSFMEMPNTVPNALTQALLEDKYAIAAQTSLANYSFFMGTSNDNLDEVLRTDPHRVCGIKIFMGSSTGNMLVDNEQVLEAVFAQAPTLIATHCEDEAVVRARQEQFKALYAESGHARLHPQIRNEEACLQSSTMAVRLAQKHGTRLHILHISTAEETELFVPKDWNDPKAADKRITSEACVHHLWFDARDYERLGNQIKCNPAIKGDGHKQRILQAVLDNRIDVIATDHAPHTWDEKQQNYWQAPAGLPLVQHSLQMMWDLYKEKKISLEKIVEKMCHNPARLFQIEARGFIREGYWADLVLVDEQPLVIQKDNIHYQCGWSPLEGHTFAARVTHTIVSGHLAYENGQFNQSQPGQRLLFVR